MNNMRYKFQDQLDPQQFGDPSALVRHERRSDEQTLRQHGMTGRPSWESPSPSCLDQYLVWRSSCLIQLPTANGGIPLKPTAGLWEGCTRRLGHRSADLLTPKRALAGSTDFLIKHQARAIRRARRSQDGLISIKSDATPQASQMQQLGAYLDDADHRAISA